jgi:hypothetical protein
MEMDQGALWIGLKTQILPNQEQSGSVEVYASKFHWTKWALKHLLQKNFATSLFGVICWEGKTTIFKSVHICCFAGQLWLAKGDVEWDRIRWRLW